MYKTETIKKHDFGQRMIYGMPLVLIVVLMFQAIAFASDDDIEYNEFLKRVQEEEPYIGFFAAEKSCIMSLTDGYENARREFFIEISRCKEDPEEFIEPFIEFCKSEKLLKKGYEEEWEKTLMILSYELYANMPIFPFTADNIVGHRDLVFAEYPNKKLKLDLFLPDQASDEPIPCIVCIHGGGWRVNRRVWFEPFAQYLASKGFAAVTIDYRMLPAVTIKKCIHDAKAAVRWVRANASKYNIDPDKVGAIGASAGAHIVALLGTTADVPELEGDGGNANQSSGVQAVVGIATPAFRISTSARRAERFGLSPEDLRLLSPYENITEAAAPLYLIHGTADETVDPQDSQDLYDKYKETGIHVELKLIPGVGHGFYEGTDIAIEMAADFFARQFNLTHKPMVSADKICDQLKLNCPRKGFISQQPASRWEESMITGNGTFGALVHGNPQNEIIILSHEKLFMPEYPPTNAPDLGKHLKTIRELVLNGEGEKAADLAVKAGKEAGIEELIWTDPLVPACQIEIESLSQDPIMNYARSVDYETGETVTAWKTKEGVFHRKMFISRPDSISALKIYGPDNNPLNFKIRLTQLPEEESERENDIEDEFASNKLIEEVTSSVNNEGSLKYTTIFKKKWEGSLKGFTVDTRVIINSGNMKADKDWLYVNDAEEILILSKIKLSYSEPVGLETGIDRLTNIGYRDLLERHSSIHSEMFNRFELKLGTDARKYTTSEELLNSSSYGKLNNDLVEQLCEAARYSLICSTGELPPTLQGIWGGTWRPAWSGDFTLNGNVPSAIACGLNCNFQEVTEAYLHYMWSMFDDFRDNAHDLYGAPGIFVPSRTSSSGKTYHYLQPFPHMFWYAGAAWTSQFFFDYWQYTSDEQFLKEKAIPFMKASADFYEFFVTKDNEGKYMFIPSYSPEIGPIGHHPVVINATMDIAALKQLLRNLLQLAEQGWIKSRKITVWKDILENLPPYEIDENGDLKEWIWPGLQNNNSHRHASHLYPLFYEMDPDFEKSQALKDAAAVAIENRLKYRRNDNGAEMAFGLVQKGLAAARINDSEHAYECVDWLCNSYWSPAFTAYHNPGEIFNVDICGGLPAVVADMIIQSSADAVELLPAIPDQWPDGEIKGVGTRCGVIVDFKWEMSRPVEATLNAQRNTVFKIKYDGKEWPMELKKDQVLKWKIN